MFFRKKKIQKTDSSSAEFDNDIRELLARDDIQCRPDVCEAEYNKAIGLLDNPTETNCQRAYDIMGNLASRFDWAPACNWMADFAESVKKDNAEACSWYKKSADLGDGNGARCYADLLMQGIGVQRNIQLAFKYYDLAYQRGVPEAAFVMGEYHRNNGDRDAATKAYQFASDKGYEPATIRLTQMNSKKI